MTSLPPLPPDGFAGFGGPPMTYTGPGAVHVHIVGSGQLYQESANGWATVCSLPCTTTVDPTGNYKIGGFLLRDSATFHFPSGTGSLDLVGSTASSLSLGRSVGGYTLVGLSVVPITLGALLLGGTFNDSTGAASSSSSGTPIAATLLFAGGAILVGIGVYLLATPTGSTIETRSGDRIARGRQPPRLALPGRLFLTPEGLAF